MNKTDLISRHLEVALQAARLAGSLVLEAGKNPHIEVHNKHQNDFVTDADLACEQLIISTIRQTFPDDTIFGEETGTNGNASHGRWILDPIDGTTNFFRSHFIRLWVWCSIQGRRNSFGAAKVEGPI
jgi:myo-inositol-1(or 4)-monophosphatase